MSVNVVTGLTGSGKTFFVTTNILPYLDKTLDPNWKIKANYHIDDSKLTRKIEYFSDPMDIKDFRKCIVLVDDAGIWFGARQWSKFPIEIQDLIINNRKNGLNIWLTTQFFENIDRTIRDNCHEYWECEKVFGTSETSKKPFGLIRASRYRPRYYDKIRRSPLSKRYVWITPEKCKQYDTYEVIKRPETKAELRKRIKEQKAEKKTLEALTTRRKRNTTTKNNFTTQEI